LLDGRPVIEVVSIIAIVLPAPYRGSEEANLALNDQDFLLLQSFLEVPLERGQKLTSSGRVFSDHPVYHYVVVLTDAAEFPKALVGLREIGQTFKSLQELLLEVLELGGFNGCSIIVVERNEDVILFHPRPPPISWLSPRG
jgi:hypothetical protein